MTTFLSAMLALGLAAGPRAGPVPVPHAATDTPARARQVTVQVQNDNFLDVNVYALSEGMTWRLGTVSGLAKATFTLPQGMSVPGAEMRLLFAPIGDWRYWVSQPVLVSPGDSVTSEIGNMLDLSTVAPT